MDPNDRRIVVTESGRAEQRLVACPRCNHENPGDNSYCTSCGWSAGVKSDGPRIPKDGRADDHESTVTERNKSMAERVVEKMRSRESADDLNYGQMVIIAAIWVLVASGLFLALWSPTSVVHLRVLIVVILGLSIANFYLHTQVLQRRPALVSVVYGASAVDLISISVIILALGGFDAPHYVFYFPAILAFSVAFRPEVTSLTQARQCSRMARSPSPHGLTARRYWWRGC